MQNKVDRYILIIVREGRFRNLAEMTPGYEWFIKQ